MKQLSNIIITALLLFAGAAKAQVYVNVNATGANNGSSWTNAYTSILEAMDAALSGDDLWVAQGTYYLHQGGPQGDSSIWLKTGVNLYGGFIGTETTLTQRDWENNATIFDGYNSASGTFSSVHIIVADNVTNCTLDGFILQHADSYNGHATELDPVACSNASGGGGSGSTSASAVLNCVSSGGGLLINQSDPVINNCIIRDNLAKKGGGAYIMVSTSVSPGTFPAPTFYNCEFSNNLAQKRGGAISLDLYTNPTFTNCRFIGNTCDSKGGAFYLDWDCDPVLTNCLLVENFAERGGAMAIDGSSNPVLTNCTVTNNSALDIGAGLYTGSYNTSLSNANVVTITNSIVWGNRAQWGGPVDFAIWHENHFDLTYSVVGLGFVSSGVGNITINPMFVDTANGDYSLQAGSPCINTGTTVGAPSHDLNDTIRDSNPDMGVYEYSSVVSSITQKQATLEAMSLKAFPNPTTGLLTVDLGATYEQVVVTVTSLIGQVVYNGNYSAVQQLNLEFEAASGVYFVKVKTEKTEATVKVIKN
ncbi:MAG: T9SS type A sorting domain-containing protein [Aureispira sp.]|nr:T9SS type A sorting domain-containing protein [Aureispira sp.]